MSDLDERIREELRAAADRIDPDRSISFPSVRHRARVLRTQTLVWILFVALIAASGTVIGIHVSTSGKPASFIRSPKHDPNLDIANAELQRQLSRVSLPAGATMASTSPSQALLGGPPEGRMSENYIVATRWWTVPASLQQTLDWIRSHPPFPLTNGTGTDGTIRMPPFFIKFLTYPDPQSTRAYDNAVLMIEVAALGRHSSAVRADGTAVWYSSQPLKDNKAGPRLRVTSAGGCPKNLGDDGDISNPASKILTTSLLPNDQPVSALRCLYPEGAWDQQPVVNPMLSTEKRLNAPDANQLQKAINALPLGERSLIEYGCMPGLRTSVEIIVFSYQGRPDIDIWRGQGCFQSLDNGFIVVFGYRGTLYRDLQVPSAIRNSSRP